MNGKATDGKIVITRKEVVRRMGNGGGCPFKYIYDVTGHDGPDLCGLERLSIARRKAKEVANGREIVEAWKSTP